MHIRMADGTEETIKEGQAYYLSPGQVPRTEDEAVELVEFTPASGLAATERRES